MLCVEKHSKASCASRASRARVCAISAGVDIIRQAFEAYRDVRAECASIELYASYWSLCEVLELYASRWSYVQVVGVLCELSGSYASG